MNIYTSNAPWSECPETFWYTRVYKAWLYSYIVYYDLCATSTASCWWPIWVYCCMNAMCYINIEAFSWELYAMSAQRIMVIRQLSLVRYAPWSVFGLHQVFLFHKKHLHVIYINIYVYIHKFWNINSCWQCIITRKARINLVLKLA